MLLRKEVTVWGGGCLGVACAGKHESRGWEYGGIERKELPIPLNMYFRICYACWVSRKHNMCGECDFNGSEILGVKSIDYLFY